MKVKELMALLSTKNPEMEVIVHMDGDLGPKLLDFLLDEKLYVDSVDNPSIVRYSDQAGGTYVEVDVVGIYGSDV